MRQILKGIKDYFKDLFNRLRLKFRPDSLSKKEKKNIKREKETANQYSTWGNILRYMTGCNDLKIRTC